MNHCEIGDCREIMRRWIAGGVKVQMCVTSPPYWGLRDYGTAKWEGGRADCEHSVGGQVQDNKAPGAITTGQRPGVDASRCRKCGARRVDQQIGLEQTPELYVQTMVEVFRLVRELLAEDGTVWLNLGDSYCGSWGNSGSRPELDGKTQNQRPKNGEYFKRGGWDERRERPASSYKISGLKPKDLIGIPWRVAFALQADGWYLRSDIIWAKPNPMPESVTDRCTKSHEYIFLLSKSARYYYDADAIAEPLALSSVGRYQHAVDTNEQFDPGRHKHTEGIQSPMELLTRAAAGVLEKGNRNKRSVWTVPTDPYAGAHFATFPPALVEPCILAGSKAGDTVLDPFFGSGTVGEVAQDLGRKWLGCELNPAYAKLQDQRTAQQGLVL